MSMHQIRLYDLFRRELRLPDDKAAAFVKAVGDVVESESAGDKHLLATRNDVHELKIDLLAIREDIHKVDLKI